MGALVFKGGTALGKLYAGNAGRFSLDLDFSVRDIDTRSGDVLDLLEEHVPGLSIGPFEYGIEYRPTKRHLLMSSQQLGSPETLSGKLDVSAPPWLDPITRGWVPMPANANYGHPACRRFLLCGSRRTWPRRSRGSTVRPLHATCTTCEGWPRTSCERASTLR